MRCGDGRTGSLGSGWQLEQLRAFGYRPPKPQFQLPRPIAAIVQDKIRAHRRKAPPPPPAPTLEQRPLKDASLRVGCIATKAGMTQEWDEHGVRVPLTVLWIDECQGVMKRWGFKGMPATHGHSLSHRSPGSIGSRQDPGRVWKGKKLPGCMGNERRTVHNCLVYKVDAARNVLYVRGQVPGPAGKSLFLRDSRLAAPALRATWGLPFPTHVPSAEAEAAAPAPGDVTAAPDPAAVSVYRNPADPYLSYRADVDYFPISWKKGE
ncbi:50S ribosomal protein L3-2, chloroplastic [Tetrabaena socialis]|uniref:Large ribosomal subunit protein uL3m n=1 Tax=Tetrabaena socialis TaxID=47790 RepID=A0A2J8A6J3_9CHLO|nr:50S ribosomal protein L3-2, chloroplastic [Tetrabaena socialis]|eukprot:PNH08117.1 50S ribosomal protein L3-2, chloroplastic [Tetrabaena socialis]